MAITKTIEEDKIEVVGELKHVGVRTATVLKEDGVEISRSFQRKVLISVQSDYDGSSWTHTDTDISGESAEVQAICNAVWTTSVKNAQKTAMENSSLFT